MTCTLQPFLPLLVKKPYICASSFNLLELCWLEWNIHSFSLGQCTNRPGHWMYAPFLSISPGEKIRGVYLLPMSQNHVGVVDHQPLFPGAMHSKVGDVAYTPHPLPSSCGWSFRTVWLLPWFFQNHAWLPQVSALKVQRLWVIAPDNRNNAEMPYCWVVHLKITGFH